MTTTSAEARHAFQRPTVAVIPCGAEKADGPCAARDLYTGGMFRSTLAAAEAGGFDYVLVLSAKYGLLPLDTEVEPYDMKMGQPGSVTADPLAHQALALLSQIDEALDIDVYGLLPKAYFATLDEALRQLGIYAAPVYEACGGIGEQRGVNRHVREH